METRRAGHPPTMTDNTAAPKPPGPTDQGRTGGMATREVAPDVVAKHRGGVPTAATEVSEEQEAEVVGLENIFASGFREYGRARQQDGMDPDRLMQNVQRAMRVALSREEERLETHLPFLATVGSTSPYIGLFGTVWGIMNSFRGLATVNQVSLAVVAPGISEALVATAIGLFAAIPAVIAYNRYSAQVEVILNRFEAFTDEFSSILYRASHQGS